MKTNSQFLAKLTVCCLFLTLLITGCVTIDSTSVEQFSTGVTAAKSQTQIALNGVADRSREEAITYAVLKNELNEKIFIETPTPETIEAWDRAFAAVERYSQSLASLVSPGAAKNFDQAAQDLAAQFNKTAEHLQTNHIVTESPQISPGIATAFTKVGELLLRAKGQATARKVAAATHPEIQRIFTLMAEAIGDSHGTPSIRATDYAIWQVKARDLKPDFLNASSPEAKRQIVVRYSDILKLRDQQDQSLSALRRSLLALADAHHALAQGNDPSLKASVAIVVAEAKRTRDLHDAFKDKLNGSNK